MKLKRILRPLTLRIYLVSLAQLLAVAGLVMLVGFLSFQPNAHGGMGRESRFAMQLALDNLDDPPSLQRELRRIRKSLDGRLSIYDAGGHLLASNVKPAVQALTAVQVHQVQRDPYFFVHGRPPLLAMALGRGPTFRGYAVYQPGRPPPPPRHMLWGLAIALVAAAVASVLLARSFAKPLNALGDATRRFGTGDLNARARLKRRDEFGAVADAFDEMAERVARVVRSQQELLANVSHELRTPLARIRVALDLAAEGDASVAREALSEINEDLAELERLVTDVLQTARVDLAAGRAGHGLPNLRSEPVHVAQLLQRAAARFQAAHPERRLDMIRDPALPTLIGDEVLLRRVIDNLLQNARTYSESGTTMRLEARATPGNLEILVEDQGVGIAPEDLPHIATPFFRSDRTRGRRSAGLGLGLSMAKRIVEGHQGSLTIESQLGKGTRVRLVFRAPEQVID
ncbi:MAG: HAMP domain-containing sensor histidine kinase [Myxococcales bacterium]